jgi:ATP-binding cassette subfamily B protein
VLNQGMVAEIGTHDELMELKGQYYDIYEKQKLQEEIDEER